MVIYFKSSVRHYCMSSMLTSFSCKLCTFHMTTTSLTHCVCVVRGVRIVCVILTRSFACDALSVIMKSTPAVICKWKHKKSVRRLSVPLFCCFSKVGTGWHNGLDLTIKQVVRQGFSEARIESARRPQD